MQETKIVIISFLIIVGIITMLIGVIATIFSLYQKKQNAFLKNMIDVRHQYEQELLKSKIEVQEQTLEHLSREIHDNIGQFLSLAKVHLTAISFEDGKTDGNKLEYAVDLVSKALEDLRDVSKSLSLDVIRMEGLTKAIDAQVVQLRKTPYSINYNVIGNYGFLDERKEIFLFRILQESLNNIIRHAEARNIEIILDCSSVKEVIMSIRDDGKGFDVQQLSDKDGRVNGRGINNMRTRAQLIDSKFELDSTPAGGTMIRIEVPVNNDYDEKIS